MMKSVQGMHSAGKLNTTKCMSYHWVWGGSFFFRDTTVVYKFLVNPSNQSVLKPPFNLAFLPGSPLSSVWSGIIYAFSHLQKHARFSQHRELTWSKQKKLQHCIYLRILSPCSHHVCFSWPAANFSASLFWSVAAGGFNVVRNTCAVVIFFTILETVVGQLLDNAQFSCERNAVDLQVLICKMTEGFGWELSSYKKRVSQDTAQITSNESSFL